MLTPAPRAACANSLAKRPLQILLVEDEPALGEVTTEALQQRGHRVTLANTIATAFSQLSTISFDAILLDLQVGPDRGEDLVLRLRNAGYWVPSVVIVSARSTLLIRLAMEEIGAAAFVQKPCVVDDIQTVLDRIVA
jgi:DNA-binding response OmpR family regulator